MLCERCGKNEAEVHLVKMVNGERHIEHVCRRCAKEMLPGAGKMMKMSVSLEGFAGLEEALRELISPFMSETGGNEDGVMHCPNCGFPLSKETLEEQDDKPDDAAIAELCHLDCDEKTDWRRELERAVKNEDYERAAQLRDKLRKLAEKKDE